MLLTTSNTTVNTNKLHTKTLLNDYVLYASIVFFHVSLRYAYSQIHFLRTYSPLTPSYVFKMLLVTQDFIFFDTKSEALSA